jgi:hypothetical protein
MASILDPTQPVVPTKQQHVEPATVVQAPLGRIQPQATVLVHPQSSPVTAQQAVASGVSPQKTVAVQNAFVQHNTTVAQPLTQEHQLVQVANTPLDQHKQVQQHKVQPPQIVLAPASSVTALDTLVVPQGGDRAMSLRHALQAGMDPHQPVAVQANFVRKQSTVHVPDTAPIQQSRQDLLRQHQNVLATPKTQTVQVTAGQVHPTQVVQVKLPQVPQAVPVLVPEQPAQLMPAQVARRQSQALHVATQAQFLPPQTPVAVPIATPLVGMTGADDTHTDVLQTPKAQTVQMSAGQVPPAQVVQVNLQHVDDPVPVLTKQQPAQLMPAQVARQQGKAAQTVATQAQFLHPQTVVRVPSVVTVPASQVARLDTIVVPQGAPEALSLKQALKDGMPPDALVTVQATDLAQRSSSSSSSSSTVKAQQVPPETPVLAQLKHVVDPSAAVQVQVKAQGQAMSAQKARQAGLKPSQQVAVQAAFVHPQANVQIAQAKAQTLPAETHVRTQLQNVHPQASITLPGQTRSVSAQTALQNGVPPTQPVLVQAGEVLPHAPVQQISPLETIATIHRQDPKQLQKINAQQGRQGRQQHTPVITKLQNVQPQAPILVPGDSVPISAQIARQSGVPASQSIATTLENIINPQATVKIQKTTKPGWLQVPY